MVIRKEVNDMVKKEEIKGDGESLEMEDMGLVFNGQSANRVFVALGKTINIGNYESFRVDVGRGRVVGEGQDFDKVLRQTKNEVMRDVAELINLVGKLLEKK